MHHEGTKVTKESDSYTLFVLFFFVPFVPSWCSLVPFRPRDNQCA
jgi:hypothetical protein